MVGPAQTDSQNCHLMQVWYNAWRFATQIVTDTARAVRGYVRGVLEVRYGEEVVDKEAIAERMWTTTVR